MTFVLDAPEDLNYLWLVAHMAGWCPYGQDNCGVFGDSLFKAIASRSTSPGDLTPYRPVIQAMWHVHVKNCLSGGSAEDVPVSDVPVALHHMLAELQPIFADWWGSPTGARYALQYWQDNFMQLSIGTMQPMVSAVRARTLIERFFIVGIEDALLREGVQAIGGSLAIRSPEHFCSLANPPE